MFQILDDSSLRSWWHPKEDASLPTVHEILNHNLAIGNHDQFDNDFPPELEALLGLQTLYQPDAELMIIDAWHHFHKMLVDYRWNIAVEATISADPVNSSEPFDELLLLSIIDRCEQLLGRIRLLEELKSGEFNRPLPAWCWDYRDFYE